MDMNMSDDQTPDDSLPEKDSKKPVRSIPEKFAIFMDDLATKDNEDLSLLLGLDDADNDEPTDEPSDEPTDEPDVRIPPGTPRRRR